MNMLEPATTGIFLVCCIHTFWMLRYVSVFAVMFSFCKAIEKPIFIRQLFLSCGLLSCGNPVEDTETSRWWSSQIDVHNSQVLGAYN
jgi:hypothetical protein